jgi:hypothetical protein
MQTSFQEFLRQKVEGSDWKDRSRIRGEWLCALNRLLDRIRDWLRESDPEGVLELITYEVERVEERLGVYDAPALQIRLNTDSADVLPMGRFAMRPLSLQSLLLQNMPSIPVNQEGHEGRVDITDGERRYVLLRSIVDGQDRWYALRRMDQAVPFDRTCLEAILKDLLS